MDSTTRTESDWAVHIAVVVALDPGGPHIFVLDNLNTHPFETLVRFVIRHDRARIGREGPSGILVNQQTWKAILGDMHHTIRFICTPKHCSWLNQIACRLSIITRRL